MTGFVWTLWITYRNIVRRYEMEKFYVDMDKLEYDAGRLDRVSSSIKECRNRVDDISENLSKIGLGGVISNVQALRDRLSIQEKNVLALSEALINIIQKYDLIETTIVGQNVTTKSVGHEAAQTSGTDPKETNREPEEGSAEYIYEHLSDEEYFAELLSKKYDEITDEEIIAMSMYFDQCVEFKNGEYIVDCDKLAELMTSMYNVDTRIYGLLGSNLEVNEFTMAPIIDSVITYRTANICSVDAGEVQASVFITDSLYAARMCYHNMVRYWDGNLPEFTIGTDENGVHTITTDIESAPEVTISPFTGESSDLEISNYRWERISTSDSELNFVIRMPDDTELNVNQYNYVAEQYTYMCSESAIHVPSHIDFPDRNTCVLMAERVILDHGANGEYAGMDQTRIAQELYAHVYMYYVSEWTGDNDFVHSASVADINLGDGGAIEASFPVIWNLGCLSEVTYK